MHQRAAIQLMVLRATSGAADAYHLGQVDDAKTAVRQNHHELGTLRNEKYMIRSGDAECVSVRQMDFKRFEWSRITHFLDCLFGHGGNVRTLCEAVNCR